MTQREGLVRRRTLRRRPRWGAIVPAVLVLLAWPSGAPAQGLADYDYMNLGFRGIGGDVSFVDAKSMDETAAVGLRLDLGFLGPQVRVMPRFAFWGADVQDEEVEELAARIQELVELPDSALDLGEIERDVFIFGADVQWAPALPVLSPYFGLGADVYILNGSGATIDDTFVEDALDLVTAGVSAVGGLELSVGRGVRVYAEIRGTLVTDVRNVMLTGGLMFTPGR